MSCTMLQAQEELVTPFKSVCDDEFIAADYPDVAFTIPSARDTWARFNIQHVTGGGLTLGDHAGKRRFGRVGFITIQLFTPNGNGLQESYRLGNMLLRAYETARPQYGMWFRNIRAVEVGKDGDWQQMNIIVDFNYDEIN